MVTAVGSYLKSLTITPSHAIPHSLLSKPSLLSPKLQLTWANLPLASLAHFTSTFPNIQPSLCSSVTELSLLPELFP